MSYRRSTLVLVGLLYLCSRLALTGLLPPWWLSWSRAAHLP